MTEKEEAMMKWRLWKSEMYAAWLSAARKKSLLSRPKRPPRPYDYSKDDRYTTAGMLYIPKKKWVSSCVRSAATLSLLMYQFSAFSSDVPRISVFSERELTFTLAICYRPSVCRPSVCL